MYITEYGIIFSIGDSKCVGLDDAIKTAFVKRPSKTSVRTVSVHRGQVPIAIIKIQFNPSLSNVTYSFSERYLKEMDKKEAEEFFSLLPNVVKNGSSYFGLLRM